MTDRDEVFLRWELGQAGAGDEAALAELLRDPAARRAFVRSARVAAALGTPVAGNGASSADEAAPPPARPRRTTTSRLRRPRPAAWPRWAAAAVLVLACGLVAFILTAPPRRGAAVIAKHAPAPAPTQPPVSAPAPFARLETAGAATIRAADGRQRTGQDGDRLARGETVETGDRPAVLVLHGDAARIDVAPGSRLGLPADAADPAIATVRLELATGAVRAEVAPRPAGAPFIVAAPLASAEVVGTGFSFTAAADGARLAVDHGAVRLSTPDDAGVLVAAGRTGLASGGLASLAPPPADADQALPADSRVLWRWEPADAAGWRGTIDAMADGGAAWRSVAAQPGDRWCSAELRSPQARDGWMVEAGTWLRFRYHVERWAPGLDMVVHLKPADESNYAARFVIDATDGWHQALLRVDGAFRQVERAQAPLAVGERIHGAVWGAMHAEGTEAPPARFWIRDAVVFTAP
jgi:hypothetical protein